MTDQANVPAAAPNAAVPRSPLALRLFLAAVTAATLLYVALGLRGHLARLLRPSSLVWVLVMAGVSLLSVPAWRGARVSMDFPLSVALAVLYPAPVAAAITFVGSWDRRELRREVTPLRALFNRSQVALATAAVATVFSAIGGRRGSPWVFLVAAVAAVVTGYVVNVVLVASAVVLHHGPAFRTVLLDMHVGPLPSFLTSFLGMGLVGAGVADAYLRLGAWTVVAFAGPLLVTRQLYVRSRAMEDSAKELERYVGQMRLLQGLAAQLDRQTDVQRIAATIAEELRQVVDYHNCRVYLVSRDGTKLLPLAFRGELSEYEGETYDALVAGIGEGVTGRAVDRGETIYTPDAANDPHAVQIPGTADIDESIVAVPMMTADRKVGAIVLSKLGIDQFDDVDVRLLEVLSSRAAAAIESARLLRRERVVASWYRALVEHLPALTYIDRLDGSPLYVSPQLKAFTGYDPEEWLRDADAWQECIHRDDRRAVAEARSSSLRDRTPFAMEYRLVRRDGTVAWVRDEAILMERPGGRSYWHGVVFDLTERREAEERVSFLAFHDALTQLPNRALFESLLQQALIHARRAGLAVAVMCLDVDDLKLVNDSLGHQVGDELLRRVATVLSESIRETDVAARMGGDEFLVMLTDLPADDAGGEALAVAQGLAERLLTRLREPQVLVAAELYVSVSVGISIFPIDADTAQTLVRNADTAMYASKRMVRGGYTVYAASRALETDQLAIATQLRRAVEGQSWLLHYQPIVEVDSGNVVAVEALARWELPDGTLRSPGDFVPLLEQMGSIARLDEWVLRELCGQLASWRASGIGIQGTINISPRELWQPSFAPRFLETVRDHGLPPDAIVVEVTEAALTADPAASDATVELLRQAGIRLAIDDFGIGYSSLSRLRELPVEIVKIDRSFVRDVEHDDGAKRIVQALLALINGLGLAAVAEGVETEGQRRFLAEHGCPLAQGFLLGAPDAAHAISARVGRDLASRGR